MAGRVTHIEAASQSRVDGLRAALERDRHEVPARLAPAGRVALGQFFTPWAIAAFMARMVEAARKRVVHVLDPGAGTGLLGAAFISEMCGRPVRPQAIHLTAYEIDPTLIDRLQRTMALCRAICEGAGIGFEARVINGDFLEAGARALGGGLFSPTVDERFDCAILNPPYRKIRADSRERRLIRCCGLSATNLYAGFLAVTAGLLASGGEMVAITPRSFCNGVYFESFRQFFLGQVRFRRVHVFETRDRAFRDDGVLQENIVFHAVKTRDRSADVIVSSSFDAAGPASRVRAVSHDKIVRPEDPHAFIHVAPDSDGDLIREKMTTLDMALDDLGLTVSTGRVVDFRTRDLLRARAGRNTVPLIHPCHLRRGFVEWPNGSTRKPNALALEQRARDLLVPAGYYVLVKRFTAKEERRRVVAAVCDPTRIPGERVAFENHLNYYHKAGCGLPAVAARGLAAFLNSAPVDAYFRQFSGHTQVNAADLRSIRYPPWSSLVALGRRIGKRFPAQTELDRIVEEVVFRGRERAEKA